VGNVRFPPARRSHKLALYVCVGMRDPAWIHGTAHV